MLKVEIDCLCKDCLYFIKLDKRFNNTKCMVHIGYMADVDEDDFCSSSTLRKVDAKQ